MVLLHISREGLLLGVAALMPPQVSCLAELLWLLLLLLLLELLVAVSVFSATVVSCLHLSNLPSLLNDVVSRYRVRLHSLSPTPMSSQPTQTQVFQVPTTVSFVYLPDQGKGLGSAE